MFYNARWYDPGLGRFAQADTIIPLQTQGVQAWDRYAGMNNNPVRYNDPSGHCVFCWLADQISGGIRWTINNPQQALKVANTVAEIVSPIVDGLLLATRATDKILPANASGSQISVSGSGAAVVGGTIELSLVTTANGEIALFESMPRISEKSRKPGAGTPQVGIAVTTGPIYGLDNNIENYEGDTVQGYGSLSSPYLLGLTGSVWGSETENGPNVFKPKVWGYDAGISFGISYPPIGSVGVSNLKATQKGQTYKLTPTQHFACRLIYQCGRTPE